MARSSANQSPRRGRKVDAGSKKQKQSMLPFYLVGGAIAIVAVALVFTFMTGLANPADGTTSIADSDGNVVSSLFVADADRNYPVGRTEQGFYYKGNPDAPVKVVEYADYQCPACGNFATSALYEQLTTEYVGGGSVQYIFRDFPLSQHRNAPFAAQAGYCAGEQGYYWAMHDQIFATQPQWSPLSNTGAVSHFRGIAEELGIDADAFESCITDGQFQRQVEGSVALAVQEQVQATPTFEVNGQRVQTLQLTAAIDSMLAGQGQ